MQFYDEKLGNLQSYLHAFKNKLEDIPFSLSFDETTHKLSKKNNFMMKN